MDRKTLFAAVCAAFFMAPPLSVADDQNAPSIVLAKETRSSFSHEDFPWGLPEGRTDDVSISLGEAVATMPWMEVEKNGDESVTITAPKMAIVDDTDVDPHDVITLTNIEMLVRQLDDAMVSSGYAETIAISDEDEDGPQASMNGFEFAFTSRGYEPVLAAAEADAEFGSDEVTAALLGLNFSLDYSVKSARIVADESGNSAKFSAGPSESSVVFGDGRLRVSAGGDKATFDVDGPFPVRGDIGKISYELSMPYEASDATQPIQFGFELSEVNLSDAIWDVLDPQGLFPHDFKAAKVDVAVDTIVKQSLFSEGSNRGREAFEPVAVRLTELEFDGIGLDVSGTADVEMDGELPKSVAGFLSVSGLSAFMQNVVKAELMPQAQAIMAEGIALQFGIEQDDGSLTFDIQTEDGVVTINEKRVAPLPR